MFFFNNRLEEFPLSGYMYMKLDIPKVKRESFANRSFSVMGPRLWNDINNEVKCVDVKTFKKS